MEEEEDYDDTDEQIKEALQKPLEEMQLSVRALAVLKSLDMKIVKDHGFKI